MSTNWYIKSVRVANYRGFRSFSLDRFRGTNIFGGLNAGGKTSLMEAMFSVMDLNNAANLVRPMGFRGLPISIDSSADVLFHNSDRSAILELQLKTRDGERRLVTKYGDVNVPGLQRVSARGETTSTRVGLTQKVYIDGSESSERILSDTPSGPNAHEVRTEQTQIPNAVMLSRRTLDFPTDLAGRFSKATQSRQKKRVVALAKSLVPEIADLELLQIGPQPVLHAELESGSIIPIQFAGDGATTIVSLGLSIMECKEGVAFIDEFEGSVHFSKLSSIWKEIATLSREFNCQLFVATHSRECIEAAVAGFGAAKLDKDLSYTRLDRVGDSVVSTRYEPDELANALNEDWEVR